MKTQIKVFFLIIILGGMVNLSYAQEKYPSKPLEVIGIWSAGGTSDLATRALCEAAEKHFGQPWVMVLKPGAGGLIAMTYLSRAKPDGYTMCPNAGVGQLVTPFFLQKPEFKQDDFEPICQWSSYHNVLAINANSPWKTMMDVVEYAKKNPGAVKYANVGKASSTHFQVEVLAGEMEIKLTPVFYKGNPDAITAVLDGIVPMFSGTYEGAKEHARAGKLRIIMTFTPGGIPEAPEIPTFKQALGKEQKILPSFNAVYVPKGTPEDRKKLIDNCVKKGIEDPKFKEVMEKLNLPIVYADAESLRKRIKEDTILIGELIRKLGMTKQ